MGLEDLMPDGVDTSSSSSRSRSSSKLKQPEESDDYKVIGGGRHKKAFKLDKWKRVKSIIRNEFGMNVNAVLNSPAEERFDVLHEAALVDEHEEHIEETEYKSEQRCLYCGDAVHQPVEIDGELFHVHHTAGQVHSVLTNDNRSREEESGTS